MRKRKIVSVTALSLALALGGCSNNTQVGTTEAVTTEQATEAVATQQTAATTQQAIEAATTQQATGVPATQGETEEDTTGADPVRSEQEKIQDDDTMVSMIQVTAHVLLCDEKFFKEADEVVTLDIDVANKTMQAHGFKSLSKQFVSEIEGFFSEDKTIFEQFGSDAYKTEGCQTTLTFKWNGSLYSWDFTEENNISGSKYFSEDYDPDANDKTGEKTKIRVMSYTTDEPGMIKKYLSMHPEFAAKYEVSFTVVTTDNGAYQCALDATLTEDNEDSPNLYMAEMAFVKKYTTGSMSSYACTYEDLGIDVEQKIKDAGIASYVADVTRRDGKVTGLAYQGDGCAFIYNREVAKAVFGDDKPETVEAAIGTDWESFFEAAEKCKEKGYAIVSGDGDIWRAIENSADQGWIVDGKLYIDPKREAFLDLSKRLKDNDYHNDTMDWSEGWFADMAEAGPKQVLGFYGPSWFIQYTLTDNCKSWYDPDEDLGTYGQWGVCRPNVACFWGGTWVIANKNVLEDKKLKEGVRELIEYITLDTSDTGVQYELANNLLENFTDKFAATSSVVMARSDGRMDILGGQDAYPYFIEAAAKARGDNLTEYDERINTFWRDAVRAYTSGEFTRDEAINWFKAMVRDSGYCAVD